MQKLVSLLFAAVLMVFLSNCGGSNKPGSEGKTNKETTVRGKNPDRVKKGINGNEEDTDAVPVQVISPTRGDISSFILFSSNVDSEKVVDVYPLTSGIIEKINYDEGDPVKKGDVLAVLDDREAVINEQKARINYEKMRMEFGRQKEIYEKQMLSKEEFERFKFNLETARLDWEHNRLLLSYTRIKTPITGVVSRRYIKAGNKINTTQMAFSVVNTREKIAVVNIPEQEKGFVFLNQKCIISSGKEQVPGLVKRISPAIDPDTGTFKVTVNISDTKNVFSVGQFVNVKIIKKVHENVVLLTKDALLYEGGKVYVFVVGQGNTAFKKPVTLGFEEGNTVEITEGVTENQKVVTAGKSTLKNDTVVKIVEPVT